MADHLADRLSRDGRNVGGWAQLMRSYVVLGQADQAVAACQGPVSLSALLRFTVLLPRPAN